MKRQFKHLHVPDQWQHYWSKYPEGYTILEALISWVKQVDDMVDNLNATNDELERYKSEINNEIVAMNRRISQFVESFGPQLQDQVVERLNIWLTNGTLGEIINREVFDMKADQTALDKLDNDINMRKYRTDRRGLVTFQFDDAQTTDYTRFKPIFEAEGVPGSVCVITSYVGTHSSYMNEAQLKELHDLGWSISSHCVNPETRLGNITNENTLDYELRVSSEWLKERGYAHDILVYPYGSVSNKAIEVARRYYQYAVDIDRLTPNYPPHMRNMKISRVPGLSQRDTPLEVCKSYVDRAVENNDWIIFEDHSQYAFYAVQENLDLLQELIQYCKLVGVEIVNLEEGCRRRGNIIDIGLDRDFFILGRNGEVVSSNATYEMKIGLDNVDNTTGPSGFPIGKVSEYRYTNAQAAQLGFPEGVGGNLITHNHTQNPYTFQEYHIHNSNNVYKRTWWHQIEEWRDWEKVSSIYKRRPDNSISAETPPTSFEDNAVTVTSIVDRVHAVSDFSSALTGVNALITVERFNGITVQHITSGNITVVRRSNGAGWYDARVNNQSVNMYSEQNKPLPSADLRGSLIVVYRGGSQGTDTLEICLHSQGVYEWFVIGGA